MMSRSRRRHLQQQYMPWPVRARVRVHVACTVQTMPCAEQVEIRPVTASHLWLQAEVRAVLALRVCEAGAATLKRELKARP